MTIPDTYKKRTLVYANGEPCKHPGCKNHDTHPCEGCGRYCAVGEVWCIVEVVPQPRVDYNER